MPPWVASVPRLTFACRRTAIERSTCARRCRNVFNLRSSNLRLRSASTHVSPTAINYRPNIPPQNKELHDALSTLSGAAEQYVNLSRLQLALRGLEAENAVTRVAVLGMNSQAGAQRLTRLLLADPLGKEQPWEKDLETADEGSDTAVLLRFGDEADAHPLSPLYKSLFVPSRILAMHNLEVLISTLNVNIPSAIALPATDSSQNTVLVPRLQPTSARGLPVPYPVHKTLILGEGLDSAITFGRFASDSTDTSGDLVKVAIDLPPPSKETETADGGESTPVNIDLGAKALSTLRASVENSISYEKNWFASNLPIISRWLLDNIKSTTQGSLQPAHRALIASLLSDIEANITRADAHQLVLLTSQSSTTQAQVSAEMIRNLEVWAEKGHEELRDSLEEAFHSRSWNRLKWWKLWWRVDDVGMVLEEMLERRWLVKTEKEAVYLAGRMKQADFSEDVQQVILAEPVEGSPESSTSTSPPEFEPIPTATATATHDPSSTTHLATEIKQQVPWPTLISTSRAALLNTTLPPLQALAQNLLLSTFSTTSIASGLSALLYVSAPSISVFEASAIAALGLTISLRRMQKVWEGARENWAMSVREEARQTLKGVETDVRGIVRGKKVEGVKGDEGVEERNEARVAVDRVREVLEKMEKMEKQVGV